MKHLKNEKKIKKERLKFRFGKKIEHLLLQKMRARAIRANHFFLDTIKNAQTTVLQVPQVPFEKQVFQVQKSGKLTLETRMYICIFTYVYMYIYICIYRNNATP